MRLIDKLMVYRGQYGYSTLLKNNDDKLYVQVGFKRGQEPLKDKVMININDGFLSFYKDKNGLAKPKIVVLSYEEFENTEPQQSEYMPPFPPMTDDELPF